MTNEPLMMPSEAAAIAALTEDQIIASIQNTIESGMTDLAKLAMIEFTIRIYFMAQRQFHTGKLDKD